MKEKNGKERIEQKPAETVKIPEQMQQLPQYTMPPTMPQFMPDHACQCPPQYMQQLMPQYVQPQMQYCSHQQMPQYADQQMSHLTSQWGNDTGMCSWMCGWPGMGLGIGMGAGTGMWSGTGMGTGMEPGMWSGYGASPGAGWMYPMMNPYNYIMRVRPAVDHGVKEAEKSSLKHAMTEVALVSYLMGMGYDYSTAHRLVESWEINDMFLNE